MKEIERYGVKGQARRAYRRLALNYHPDRGGDEETFKRINEWYTQVRDLEAVRLAGRDRLVRLRLTREDVDTLLNGGRLQIEVLVQRTGLLGQEILERRTIEYDLGSLDQATVLDGLGEEGYPDGSLILFFDNLIAVPDGWLVLLHPETGRDEPSQSSTMASL